MVKRLQRMIALLLAALWLPAVVHCAVEALEMASPAEDRCCSHESSSAEETGGGCLADPCGVFDEGHFRGGDEAAAFDAPAQLSPYAFVAWCNPGEAAVRECSVAGPPPDAGIFAAEWVFVRRAAPWANAPGLSAG